MCGESVDAVAVDAHVATSREVSGGSPGEYKHHFPSSFTKFLTAWWLGHPSEKYESQWG